MKFDTRILAALALAASATSVTANDGTGDSDGSAPETVTPLSQLRGILSGFESAIIHTALSRSAFAQLDLKQAQEEQYQVRAYLKEAVQLDGESQFTSAQSTVPEDIFSSEDSLPYLQYERNQSIGAQYGDEAAEYEPSIWSYTFDSLYPPNDSNDTATFSSVSPPTVALSGNTFSLFSLISSRIGNGKDVALAKLYDATSEPKTTDSPPNGTVCGYLQDGNVDGVREFLTDLKQVQNVRNSVKGKTEAWVNQTGMNTAEEWVPKIVGLFDIIVNVTTDLEVSTLLQRQASGQTGC